MDSSRTQLVIVALPTENDYVRKISSEKEPHLTLLYLGEPKFDQGQITRLQEYVDYASTLLPQFTLEVNRRGELGEQKADVLFFYKDYIKTIKTFRDHLLAHPLISTAYNAADQFEGWTPHLTLGYPSAPAKKPSNDYDASVTFVKFDRVALWIGDSEGPTFDLKPYSYEEVAMSHNKSSNSTIAHYGVRGMRWGVSRTEEQIASAPAPRMSEDAKTANKLQDKADFKGTGTLSNQEMRQLLERMDLERRYDQAVGVPSSGKNPIDRGHDQVKKILAIGQTYEKARKFMETPTGKAVKTGLKTAAAAGFGYATGGTGAAAAAAGSSLMKRMS